MGGRLFVATAGLVVAAALAMGCGGGSDFATPPPAPASVSPAATAAGGSSGTATPAARATTAPPATAPAATATAAEQRIRTAAEVGYLAYWAAYAEALRTGELGAVAAYVGDAERAQIAGELAALAGRNLSADVRVVHSIESIEVVSEHSVRLVDEVVDSSVAVLPGGAAASDVRRPAEARRVVASLELTNGRWRVVELEPRIATPATTLVTRAAEVSMVIAEELLEGLSAVEARLIDDYIRFIHGRRAAFLELDAELAFHYLARGTEAGFAAIVDALGEPHVAASTHRITAIGTVEGTLGPRSHQRWVEDTFTDASYAVAAGERSAEPAVLRVRVLFYEVADPDGRFQVDRITRIE